MRRLVAVILTIAALAGGPPASGGYQPDPKFEQLSSLITQKMTEHGIPGVAFGMVRNGQVTVRGFGVTNVDDPQPITPDTIFPLASISKTIAATAIMRLVEQARSISRHRCGLIFRSSRSRTRKPTARWPSGTC